VSLPFTTQIILAVADFMSKQWFLSLLAGAGLVLIIYFAATIKGLKKPKSWLILRIPLLAPLAKKMNSALMLRTLSSLFKSGVPIIRALNITASSLNNYYFQRGLQEAALKIEKGRKLAEALKPYEFLYPVGVLQMVEVGEETGETAEVLRKLAEFYEEDVTAATEQLSSVIEPFLILFIGGIVGFFAISMMQPMFSMIGNVR
jgi:type IV pilus assembly protein PilC